MKWFNIGNIIFNSEMGYIQWSEEYERNKLVGYEGKQQLTTNYGEKVTSYLYIDEIHNQLRYCQGLLHVTESLDEDTKWLLEKVAKSNIVRRCAHVTN